MTGRDIRIKGKRIKGGGELPLLNVLLKKDCFLLGPPQLFSDLLPHVIGPAKRGSRIVADPRISVITSPCLDRLVLYSERDAPTACGPQVFYFDNWKADSKHSKRRHFGFIQFYYITKSSEPDIDRRA